ncbi:Methylase of polypeptide chain release factors [Streptomyces sp. WMMB 714]|uniref:methyltransferase n=1 Tax=Streptomyces sp. WMMB 714 TaxID=1286822 RepID=UPI0005F7D863|nr:class I SAM-dependent methyltransferase [Streptomyces sp. WMMB 714]SCK12181.1 Methylase of polypeptide chain release factors [Streptomyces sp. WMMB 714]
MDERQTVGWTEDDEERSALWRSENGMKPPRRVRPADDRTTADAAYKLACEGTALLWRGDFHGARQLLSAMRRRVDRKQPKAGAGPREDFHLQRQAQARRARVLGMLLVPLDTDAAGGTHTVPLRRAPDVAEACAEAYGPPAAGERSLVPLRELLGVIGAHEWRRRGVPVPALDGERVRPAYGVFSPVRGEYVDLVARTRLPPDGTAFDIGTGTGVLSAVLARRGLTRVVATDQDPRALDCARENLRLLGAGEAVTVVEADLFPPGDEKATLIVCNPPWLPAKPTSPLEHAVYDPGSRMLRGFLAGLAERLAPGGEGWLILSDLAEHLQLRSREELFGWIGEAGLTVAGREDTRPHHPRSADPADPLHAARSAEVTSLWRLRAAAA